MNDIILTLVMVMLLLVEITQFLNNFMVQRQNYKTYQFELNQAMKRIVKLEADREHWYQKAMKDQGVKDD